jgi:hypothetical protein
LAVIPRPTAFDGSTDLIVLARAPHSPTVTVMSLALFNFISVAIVVFLLIYLIVIRVAKLRFDSQPVDARLLSVLISVTQDMNFRWICNNYCQINHKQSNELFELLNNPQRLRICADYVFRNGWVGYLPQEGCYGLALPRRRPAFLLWTATCHELFTWFATFRELPRLSRKPPIPFSRCNASGSAYPRSSSSGTKPHGLIKLAR